jgi:hypothetical protein
VVTLLNSALQEEPMFDLPPRNIRQIKRLSFYLTRKDRRRLAAGCFALLIVGYLHSYVAGSSTALPRYGALMTLMTFWHAFRQFNYLTMFERQAKPVGVDVAKELGKEERAPELLSGLQVGIARRFLLDHLAAASLGTVIWGFGDLLPLATF